MTFESEDYILGEDVSASAKTSAQRGTVVISVRLSVDEAGRLDRLSRATGKSVSQVIRDAIAAYDMSSVQARPDITLCVLGDQDVTFGGQAQGTSGPLVVTEGFSPPV